MIEAGLLEVKAAKKLPQNSKLHDVQDIGGSLSEFGFVDRIIINRITGNMVSGHGRVDALAEMMKQGISAPENIIVNEQGEWMAPVDYIECPAGKEDALAIRLNLTQMKGGKLDLAETLAVFDLGKLYETAVDLQAKKFLEASGLHEKALKYLIEKTGGKKADPEPQINKTEELRVKLGVELGQLWQVGQHKIICGDCTDAAVIGRLMGDDKATCLFTDPPYGVSIGAKNRFLNSFQPYRRNLENIDADDFNKEDLEKMLLSAFSQAKKFLADDCSVFVCAPQGGQLGMMMMMMMMKAGLEVRHILNWVKNGPTFSMGRLDYEYQHEPILFTWMKTHKRNKAGAFHTSVWNVDKPRASADHPTMKPVELPENAIANHTDIDDVVIDIFLGSGTTLVACERMNRIGRGIEISPGYVAVAIQRLADMGLSPKLVEGENDRC